MAILFIVTTGGSRSAGRPTNARPAALTRITPTKPAAMLKLIF